MSKQTNLSKSLKNAKKTIEKSAPGLADQYRAFQKSWADYNKKLSASQSETNQTSGTFVSQS